MFGLFGRGGIKTGNAEAVAEDICLMQKNGKRPVRKILSNRESWEMYHSSSILKGAVDFLADEASLMKIKVKGSKGNAFSSSYTYGHRLQAFRETLITGECFLQFTGDPRENGIFIRVIPSSFIEIDHTDLSGDKGFLDYREDRASKRGRYELVEGTFQPQSAIYKSGITYILHIGVEARECERGFGFTKPFSSLYYSYLTNVQTVSYNAVLIENNFAGTKAINIESSTTDPTKLKEIATAFRNMFNSPENAGKNIITTGAGITVKDLTEGRDMNYEDMQKISKEYILLYLKVPLTLYSSPDVSVIINYAESLAVLYKQSILPKMRKFLLILESGMGLSEDSFKINMENLTVLQEGMASIAKLMAEGDFTTPNDRRRVTYFEPVVGEPLADQISQAVNHLPLSLTEEAVKSKSKGVGAGIDNNNKIKDNTKESQKEKG